MLAGSTKQSLKLIPGVIFGLLIWFVIYVAFVPSNKLHKHYGQGKSELEAKVWYLTIVKQFALYGCTLFPILHKGLWSHSHDALLAINMDGVKFVRAKDKKVLHDFKYGEIESIALDPNDNYVTMELKNDVAKDCPQRCFMFETNHKEDLGNLIASYSPVHSTWLKPDYEGVKKEFIEFVEFLFKKCKEHLCLYIHQAAHTVEWTYLSKESQKEIMEEANYVFIENPNKGRMARPQLTSMQREFIEFVEFLFKKCKEHLCLYIHQAAHTVEWTYLSKESQKEIMEEANYVFIENPNKGRMARPQLTSMQRKVTGASGLSLKEYFDQHFGVKTLDKKSKSPSPANHISSTKTQTKSKSNLPTSGAKKSKIVTEMEKTTSRPTAAKPSISKGGNSDTKKKSGGTSTVKLKQKEATHLAGAASGKMKGKTDAKSENSRTVEHKSTENLQQICVDHEVDNEMNDNDADNQPTSESAGYTLHYLQQALGIEREPFVPQFGHSRLQGADGVVNDRQGWTIVVQRPAQILNVEFTMPEL